MTESPSEDPNHSSFSFEDSQLLFLFTSLTAGSSHVITATSRLETILKANRIPFRAIDTATNEKARRIWGRRAGKRKLPGLVREGWVLADLEEVEEWNEYGELKEQLAAATGTGLDSTSNTGVSTPTTTPGQSSVKDGIPTTGIQTTLPIREAKNTTDSAVSTPTTETSISFAPMKPSPSRLNTNSSRNGDDVVSPSEGRSPHNTSYITGLPPIRIPSGSGSAKQADTSKSSTVSDPPPPPATATNAIKNEQAGMPLKPPGDPTDSAGPASKSGLAAVTDYPETSDASTAVAQIGLANIKEERGRARERADRETMKIDIEDHEEFGAMEKQDSFVKGKPGSKVTFTDDELKGDALDGSAAAKSVGD